jgi:hypothetical protein
MQECVTLSVTEAELAADTTCIQYMLYIRNVLEMRERLQRMSCVWSDSNSILVDILPYEDEYRKVADALTESIDDAHISRLWRIQNRSLWTYYSFHKDRLSMHGITHNETSVWHGTSTVDPAIIYNNKKVGFMMQYPQSGLWG